MAACVVAWRTSAAWSNSAAARVATQVATTKTAATAAMQACNAAARRG